MGKIVRDITQIISHNVWPGLLIREAQDYSYVYEVVKVTRKDITVKDPVTGAVGWMPHGMYIAVTLEDKDYYEPVNFNRDQYTFKYCKG